MQKNIENDGSKQHRIEESARKIAWILAGKEMSFIKLVVGRPTTSGQATHPNFVTYERGNLLKHTEVEAWGFAKRLHKDGGD